MPIVNFHLTEGSFTQENVEILLAQASEFYVDTLYPGLTPRPLDRVRTFVTTVPAGHWATAGELVSRGAAPAPYFTCLALAGRPEAQLARLLAGFTDLVERHIACARSDIRGQVISIDPAHWSIGGMTAATVRANEVSLRATGGKIA